MKHVLGTIGFFTIVLVACSGSSDSSVSPGSSSGGSSGGGSSGGSSGGGSSGGSSGGGSSGGSSGSTTPGAGLFPASSPWYQDISNAPVDAEWPTIRAAVDGAGGWGAGGQIEINFEFHVLHADASVARRSFDQTDNFYEGECDTAPIPVPPGGAMEGSDDYACDSSDNDCHLIVLQGSRLYEAWRANISGGSATGAFTSGCLAIWDVTKDYWQPVTGGAIYSRGDHCSSADAAGYPITPLLFSADEVAAGEIKHAIRFIMPNDRIQRDVYVHPAVHAAGTGDADVLPYGARLRLKASADLSKLKPWAKVVAVAMQKYGMFLADGGEQALTAQSDQFTTAKWGSNLTQDDLSSLAFTDFEMIEGGTRIPKSGQCLHDVITQ
jgi:hypothetical protein